MAGGRGGRRAGAGRPKKTVAEQRERNQERVVLELTPPEELDRVWQTLLAFAKAGDSRAIKLVLAYVLGQPVQTVDVTIREEAAKIADEVGVSVDELIAEAERIAARA